MNTFAALHPEFWWYVTRASGLTAWIASLGASVIGLALATRTLGSRPKGPWLLDVHRGLSGITVVFVVAHVVALVADSYVHFGAAEVLVPGMSDWRPAAVAAGVVAFWVLAAVVVTSLATKHIPKRVWRTVHLTSYAAAVSATIHTFTAGTDASHPGVLLVAGVATLSAVFMFAYRRLAPAKPARVLPRSPRVASPTE